MEYADKKLSGRELTRFLSDLREHNSYVPELKILEDAFALIRDHPAISEERVLFDPEMPVSSTWSKVRVKKSEILELVSLLTLAKEKIQSFCDREGVPDVVQKNERIKQKQDKERIREQKRVERQRLDEAQERKRDREDEWVKSMLSQINDALQEPVGLRCIGEFLIDTDRKEIYVLTVHTSYQKERMEREVRVTSNLQKKYPVYEIEESSPPGSGHIPYFAGAKRSRVMGWRQNKSVLFCSHVEDLQKAIRNRDKYLTDQALELD